MNCLLFQETNQQKGHLPMIGRILVALGAGPSSSSAIQQAIELARLHGAELTAVALFDLPRLSHVGRAPIGAAMAGVELRRYRLTTAEQSLDEAIAEFEAACLVAGLSHRVCREEGDPIDRLVALSRYHDVVVAGLHGLLEWGVIDEPPDELIHPARDGPDRPVLAVEEHQVEPALQRAGERRGVLDQEGLERVLLLHVGLDGEGQIGRAAFAAGRWDGPGPAGGPW